ncbi:MAG TPA: peptidoglycan-binding protein, partial [Allosphingosinicella sp.]|nr:peptidoglycan-binding protein [Allosphingosinicella sp.]
MMFRLFPLLVTMSLSAPAFAREVHPIEPIDLPPSIQQGVDLIYIDPEMAPAVRDRDALLHDVALKDWSGAPVDLLLPVNPLYTDLRRGLVRYRMTWGALPDVEIPRGPVLKPGAEGERVALLRQRLGLPAGNKFDADVARAVRLYQEVHALKADGIAGDGTIASLNLGSGHYERLLMINLERARRLPGV